MNISPAPPLPRNSSPKMITTPNNSANATMAKSYLINKDGIYVPCQNFAMAKKYERTQKINKFAMYRLTENSENCHVKILKSVMLLYNELPLYFEKKSLKFHGNNTDNFGINFHANF